MNIHEVRFRNELVVPDLFEEGCSREQLSAPLHHVLEQPKLARSQVDLTVATLRSAIQKIEFQWPHAQRGFIWWCWQPDHGFCARYQFNYRERLFCGVGTSQGRSAQPINHLLECAREQRMN